MPYLPAGPPEGSPPDLIPIESLLQREFLFVALDDPDITHQYVATPVEVPFLPEYGALLIKRFDDVRGVFPARHTLCLDRADGHFTVFAERELLYDGAIETDKKTVLGLCDLERFARLEEHVH